jgi:hypothetical protein
VGFDASNLLTFQVQFPKGQYTSELPPGEQQYGRARVSAVVEATYEAILERLRPLPGVRSVSAISWLPMNGVWGDMRVFAIVGLTPDEQRVRASAGWWNTVDEIETFADAVRDIAANTPDSIPRRLPLLGQ